MMIQKCIRALSIVLVLVYAKKRFCSLVPSDDDVDDRVFRQRRSKIAFVLKKFALFFFCFFAKKSFAFFSNRQIFSLHFILKSLLFCLLLLCLLLLPLR